MLEVSLTRVFSVMTWHHFAYMIISLALLGFGVASTFLTVSPRFSSPGIDEAILAKYALAFCLSSVFGFAAATKVRFYLTDVGNYGDISNAFSLLLLYVLVGVPFFYAGVCIGYLISRAGDAVNRLYFADLVGAGTGALLSVAGINGAGVEATIYGAGLTGGIVALLYARAGGWLLRVGTVAAFGLALLMTVAASRTRIFPVYFPPDKMTHGVAMTPHYERWHAVAKVDILEPSMGLWDFGGILSPQHDPNHQRARMRAVFQDGGAPTGIVEVPEGDVSKVPTLQYYLQGAPYAIKSRPDDVLVIGVGGGVDVLIALYHHARHVVGVELNPVIAEAVAERFADFAGHVFSRPDVDLVVSEGRHYLTAVDKRFDVIQLSGVDTCTALSLGAYALSENYLYTVDAMHDYWRHLQPEGVLSFSRWLLDPPRESLRLVAIQLEFLRQIGVEAPERHLVVISGGVSTQNAWSWAETLLKRGEFQPAELAACREWARKLRFELLYDPYRPRDNAFDRLIRAPVAERQEIIRQHPCNIDPISDDDPFFFHTARWRSLTDPEQGILRLLGLWVPLVSLVQILVLASALIIGPLISQRRRVRQVRHKGRLLVYFAALGLAFITVEISLLQKYAVFVGGPVYAMVVTLFAVLIFSGLGSLLARYVTRLVPHGLTVILLSTGAAIVGEVLFVNHVVPQLMFLPHTLRCLVTVSAVAPVAFLMGMPFPTGLRVAQHLGQPIVPWAWGVNAIATTLGALLSVLVSISFGFTTSLLAAAALYLVALLVRLEDLGDGADADAVTTPRHDTDQDVSHSMQDSAALRG